MGNWCPRPSGSRRDEPLWAASSEESGCGPQPASTLRAGSQPQQPLQGRSLESRHPLACVFSLLSCHGPCRFSRVQFFATPWTGAHQAPLSMGFPRQEHQWVALSFSGKSSPPRVRTCISYISGIVFSPFLPTPKCKDRKECLSQV